MQLPHDLADLRLAPVLLHVERRLQVLSQLQRHEVAVQVTLWHERHPVGEDERAAYLLEAATRDIDLAGWEVSWDDSRGVRLRHGDNTVTLGVSAEIRSYVRGGGNPL